MSDNLTCIARRIADIRLQEERAYRFKLRLYVGTLFAALFVMGIIGIGAMLS